MMNTPTRRAVDRLAALEELSGGGGGGGGSVGSVLTVTGGQTQQASGNTVMMLMDSSNGTAPTGILPTTNVYVGRQITVWWYSWNGAQVPPQIQAGGSNKMSPPGAGSMSSSGAAGLVTSGALSNPGTWATYMWSNVGWLQIG